MICMSIYVWFVVFWFVRCQVVFRLRSAPKQHTQRVAEVQRQVKEWNDAGRQGMMCTARPGWLTMSLNVGKYKKTFRNINVNLCDVLEVDTTRKVVRVEPLCSMGQVSATLLPLGWTLPVVPELDDLTVGGLICGVGVETSSHKYGLFSDTYVFALPSLCHSKPHPTPILIASFFSMLSMSMNSCVAYEVVLADGSFVRCTKEENSELFYAIPWSHGTLGFLVAAEISIVPAKKYVRVQYIPAHTEAEGIRIFTQLARDQSINYVESLVFNKNQQVVMAGVMTDACEGAPCNSIGRWHKPWFFKYVQTMLKKKVPAVGAGESKDSLPIVHTEYIPLRHYYHRHTKSIFWELEDILKFGNNVVFRWVFGWLMPPKISLLKLTTTGPMYEMYEKHHVVQDMLVPITALSQSFRVFDEEFNVYPLWVCPMRIPHAPKEVRPFVRSLPEDDLFVDIGAYGVPKAKGFEAKASLRRVEDYVRSVKG
jgi:delta24-sterol reductase